MLRGHVFKYQTFSETAFAHFINTFLRNNIGVTKGCNLSHTTNSATISAGFFCIYGRFLEVVGNETISNITNTGYYSLVCNVDLSKTNTKTQLLQAELTVVRNTSGYPTLTKENLDNGGNVYQYEFARFRVTDTGITDFQDRRTFLSIDSIYTTIRNEFNTLFEQKNQEAETLLEEIRQELVNVMDGSVYLLKSGGTITGGLNVNGGITGELTGNCSGSSGSCTGNAGTATKLKQAKKISLTGTVAGNANFDGSEDITIQTTQNNIAVLTGTVKRASDTVTQKTISIDFPDGYNGSNSVIISACVYLNQYESYDLGYGGYYTSDINVSLPSYRNYISVHAENMLQSARYDYKIVLLKIS